MFSTLREYEFHSKSFVGGSSSFFKSLSLFIKDLRDVGNQPAHQLVLTEALIFDQ